MKSSIMVQVMTAIFQAGHLGSFDPPTVNSIRLMTNASPRAARDIGSDWRIASQAIAPQRVDRGRPGRRKRSGRQSGGEPIPRTRPGRTMRLVMHS